MKFIFALFLSLFCVSTFASVDGCRAVLTSNFERSSSLYAVDLDSLEVTAPVADRMGQAVQIIRDLVVKEGCSKTDINFGQGSQGRAKSRCDEIIPDRSASMSCYIETNLGYFFVHWDPGHFANIIFNQWD